MSAPKTKELQVKMDMLASQRSYWRLLLAALTEPKTKDIMAGLKARIQAKADDYITMYDKVDPNDPIGIARSQEGRLLCRTLLSEFDTVVCEKTLDALDKQIKTLSDDIREASSGDEVSGYQILMGGKK